MKKIERNPLRDILDHQRIHQLEKAGTSTIFPVYKPKDDIAKNIFAAINKRCSGDFCARRRERSAAVDEYLGTVINNI